MNNYDKKISSRIPKTALLFHQNPAFMKVIAIYINYEYNHIFSKNCKTKIPSPSML